MSRFIKSTYEYSKPRKYFGRQTLFQMVPGHILDSIEPNEDDQKMYMLRNPVNREIQATMPQSEHDSNTKLVVFHEQGVNHTEGGWPREVHADHEELVARHRRRVMHDDNYVHAVLSLSPIMRHYVKQNNAIEMYQTYFADMHPLEPVEKYNVRIANVFRDPLQRPVSSVAWTIETESRLAVSHCCEVDYNFDLKLNEPSCYLWDINNPSDPVNELISDTPCWRLACSPVDSYILIGGLENGIVNVFDIREGTKAVASSSIYNSHRRPITALLYTHSRTNTEFFTGSPDGECLWWDMRNLSNPIYRLPMSIRLSPGDEPNLTNAEGVSCLNFDRNLPTKFLCGTESGLVINVNRIGRTHSEVLCSYWNAHLGPVRAIHRSPCTLRMFVTCGDYSVRIWSEEVRTAPIIVTRPYRHQVMDVTWAPLRYSCYMSVCEGGYFYYWDFLRKYQEPLVTLQVSKHPLTKLMPHADGKSVAVADNYGSVFLIHLSENMSIPGSRDKSLMFQTYERETRREHILDTRMKEIHLKKRVENEGTNYPEPEVINEELQDKVTEEEYLKIVNKELRQIEEIPASSEISNS